MLHRVIRECLDDFLRAAADRADGAGLPGFIAREFRKFLTCGALADGFARVRCERCAFEMRARLRDARRLKRRGNYLDFLEVRR